VRYANAISRVRRRPRVSTTPVFALATEGQRDRFYVNFSNQGVLLLQEGAAR
jgi:hypothetical protein